MEGFTDILTILLALLASLFFAASIHLQRQGLDHISAREGTLVSVFGMAGTLWIVAPFVIEWSWWLRSEVVIFALCGVFFPAFSQWMQIRSVVHVGPAIGSAIGAFVPVFAVTPAVLFLGEPFSTQIGVGMTILIGALVMSALSTGKVPRAFPVIALIFPLGAAFFRGVQQPFSKFGMETLPSPVFAALVMTSVSAVVISGLTLGTARQPHPGNVIRGRMWFAATGMVVSCGIMALQSALSTGNVTIVAPLIATVPVWALLMGWAIFRRERLALRHLWVALLTVCGALLIITG